MKIKSALKMISARFLDLFGRHGRPVGSNYRLGGGAHITDCGGRGGGGGGGAHIIFFCFFFLLFFFFLGGGIFVQIIGGGHPPPVPPPYSYGPAW